MPEDRITKLEYVVEGNSKHMDRVIQSIEKQGTQVQELTIAISKVSDFKEDIAKISSKLESVESKELANAILMNTCQNNQKITADKLKKAEVAIAWAIGGLVVVVGTFIGKSTGLL